MKPKAILIFHTADSPKSK